MNLVQKLTIVFVAAAVTVLGANGYLRVRREVALFEAHAIAEHRSVGRALRGAVLAVFRTEGETRALELVDEATRDHQRIRFRWVWLDPSPHLHASPSAILVAPEGQPLTVEDRDLHGVPTRFTYVRATVPDGRRGALELAESLREQQQYVQRTVFEASTTVSVLVLLFGLVAVLASSWFVGRPVGRLVEKARRVADGDFSRPVVIGTHDEFGALGDELNATCERLVQARDRLEAETTAKIAAVEQLRHAERLSTLGKLASGIAHELGTPMNLIVGHADLIASREVEGDGAVASAKVIGATAQRISSLIREFLGYARRRGPQRSDYDLCKIAAQSSELLRAAADKKQVRLVLENSRDVVADVDSAQIQQVVTNLVMNAIQAAAERGLVRVSCGVEGKRAFIRVEDDGPGIPDDVREQIFDPFFTTKPMGEGTGLGLSVVHSIVSDHQGTIDVHPRDGGGTVFVVWLPL